MRFLLLAAAALIALTPGVASAHGSHDHGVAEQPASAAQAQSHSWTTPCPGGAGGNCCCEKLVACSLGAKPPVIAGGGLRVANFSAQTETLRPLRAAPPSRLARSPSLARAPPSPS